MATLSISEVLNNLRTYKRKMTPRSAARAQYTLGEAGRWLPMLELNAWVLTEDTLRTLHTITRDMVKNTTQCCQPADRAAHTAHTTRLGEEALASMVACSFSKADMAKHDAHLRRMWKEHANALVARGWSKDRVHALCGQYERPCDKVSALAMARWP